MTHYHLIPQSTINETINLLRELTPIPTDLILTLLDAKKIVNRTTTLTETKTTIITP